MEHKRGQWGSRMGFVVAAIGSAIGLGNIWRFPYIAVSNGGGAFLIPYLFALFTAGIPILILEFSVAQRVRHAAPGVFGRISRKMEVLGWVQTMINFGIITYYTVIVGWTINYLQYAWQGAWGENTKEFFFGKFLHVTSQPFEFGSFNTGMLIALVMVWLINYIVLLGGIKSGIEKANKILMPLLVISLLVIVVRGVTLSGASKGLDYFFSPDFSKLTDPSVWIAAYSQIFFSLSICFGIIMTYASYLPAKSDLVNNAFLTGLGNCSFSLLSGIAVFSVLGYMAASQGLDVADVSSGGIGLAFVVFPTAINTLPGMQGVMGSLFFLCLVFAGLSSSISVLEVLVTSLSDKFKTSRTVVLTLTVLIGFSCSLIYVSGAGIYFLDIIDHVINNYAITIAGLVEVIFLGWWLKLESTRTYVNSMSDFSIGRWWIYSLKIVTPLLLGIMFVFNTYKDFTKGYEGYPLSALIIIGGGVLLLILVGAGIFTRLQGERNFETMLGKGVQYHE